MSQNELKPCPLEETLYRLNDFKHKCEASIEDSDNENSYSCRVAKEELQKVNLEIEAVKLIRDKGYFREWKNAFNTPTHEAKELLERIGTFIASDRVDYNVDEWGNTTSCLTLKEGKALLEDCKAFIENLTTNRE